MIREYVGTEKVTYGETSKLECDEIITEASTPSCPLEKPRCFYKISSELYSKGFKHTRCSYFEGYQSDSKGNEIIVECNVTNTQIFMMEE